MVREPKSIAMRGKYVVASEANTAAAKDSGLLSVVVALCALRAVVGIPAVSVTIPRRLSQDRTLNAHSSAVVYLVTSVLCSRCSPIALASIHFNSTGESRRVEEPQRYTMIS